MENDIHFVEKVLSKYLDSKKNFAFIFGSRAISTASKFSDYDIGIEGEKIDPETYFSIIQEFEDSDFIYKVDLVDFNNVSESFMKIAKKHIIPLNL